VPADRHEPLRLFEGIGVELEYMIVNRQTLDVAPICDELLKAQTGHITSEFTEEDISWSNELVLHVIELKTSGPAPQLAGLSAWFDRHVKRMIELAGPLNARLMPGGMHPWMEPRTQMRLWPHEYRSIYETFDRIFNCHSHGWANLQSMHINLPFATDEEFGRLHAAIRLVLPILPALTASSPMMDGFLTGRFDNRLDAYRQHCAFIPSVAGRIIPEPIFDVQEYHDHILEPIYRDMAPFDPEGILRYEFANARGAIARFERNTIEIRVIDMQECPAADLAIAVLVVDLLRLLVAETWSDYKAQRSWAVDPLADLFEDVIEKGDRAVIASPEYLRVFGWDTGDPCRASDFWRYITDQVCRSGHPDSAFAQNELDLMLERGSLSRRLIEAMGSNPSRQQQRAVYAKLCDCLEKGEMFVGKTAAPVGKL
jgi:gamma-glutamyl:cysteine ligase YbdK (ATP-grasp superfamily)